MVELFFGRGIPGRAPLSNAEWADFTATVITPRFPDGLTILDGDGQWRNPTTATIGREHTKIVLIAARPAPDLASRIDEIRDAYRARFHQVSVGVITTPACGAF